LRQDDPLLAVAMFEESLELFRSCGAPVSSSYDLHHLAVMDRESSRFEQARERLCEALRLAVPSRDKRVISGCLDELAMLAFLERQHWERAAHLAGAAESLRGSIGAGNDYPIEDDLLAPARNALGEAAFAQAWAEGRAMTLEQAIALALGGSESNNTKTPPR
jgi:non-specific serine/threonine protein kinase